MPANPFQGASTTLCVSNPGAQAATTFNVSTFKGGNIVADPSQINNFVFFPDGSSGTPDWTISGSSNAVFNCTRAGLYELYVTVIGDWGAGRTSVQTKNQTNMSVSTPVITTVDYVTGINVTMNGTIIVRSLGNASFSLQQTPLSDPDIAIATFTRLA